MNFDEPIVPVPASRARLRSARRLLRRKDRQAAGQFLAEGRQSVAEALNVRGAVEVVLVAEDAVEVHQGLLGLAAEAGIGVEAVSGTDFTGLSDTVTPQGLLALCRRVDVNATVVWASSPRLVVLCDQIRDPGNLGTVIRCADAFGADAVLVSRDSVDLYNPKTVRASTGSLFHLPIAVDLDLRVTADTARAAGLQVLGADGRADTTIDDLARSGALARPTLWVLGNEAHGLNDADAALLDQQVALPMYGRAESLNLATAAAVLLYATATAQREGHGG